MSPAVTALDLADALTALRERPPLVQCLTNVVVAGWTANVLLAVGAAVGALGWRTSLALQLLREARPSIIRGNASQILALAGGTGGRGVESVDSPEAAAQEAIVLAEQQHCVIAVSGPTDHITDGHAMVKVSNGHPWLTRVTGGGCALGALMAAFAAVVPDAVVAAAAATATLTVAAESAAACSRGPGSFAVALLDELAMIEPADLAKRARIS